MTTNKTLQKIDVFISSPSDVYEERQITVRVLTRLNKMPYIADRYFLKPLAYEDNVPAAVGQGPQASIDRYMMEAGKADLFICVLCHRMGTPVVHEKTGERFRSGTEYEFVDAYRANQQHGRPHMLLYRGMKPIPSDADDETLSQIVQLRAFFKQFEGGNAGFKGLYKTYHTLDEFEEILFDDLNTVISKIFITPGARDTISPIQLVVPERADFYQHIPLPPNYIPRADLLQTLRTALLAEVSGTAVTKVASNKLIALHGMGGIGKSVAARALCEDASIKSAFPDGILWTTLGQEPELPTRLREWIHALGGTISENAPSEDSLRSTLARLLEKRECLLIIDDVWQIRHIDAFRLGSVRCHMLFTTRDAEIARTLGAAVLSVPIMTQDEAIRLLKEWAGNSLTDTRSTLVEQIVERLGRLPLALKLAGAQLQRRSPEEWLQTFDARKLRSKRPENVHDNLEQTLGLSLDALQTGERRLYTLLAVFKKNEAIPEVAIRLLWEAFGNLSSSETSELIDDLSARALIEVAQTTYPRAVVLHDLLRDFVSVELGDNYEEAHRSLLRAYRKTQKGEGWHTAPDDGYLYSHLSYHLQSIGSTDELKGLFADQNWLSVRVPQCGYEYDGYLDDLSVTWKFAREELKRQVQLGLISDALAQNVRYALIQTSVNSIAGNYVPEIIMRAVEAGFWSPGRAVSVAHRIPDPGQRVATYASLIAAGILSPDVQEKIQRTALATAFSIENAIASVKALLSLLPHLPNELRMLALEQAVEASTSIEEEWERAEALTILAPHLQNAPQEVLARTLEMARRLEDKWTQTEVLIALTPQLQDQQAQAELAAALSIKNEQARSGALIALTPHIPHSHLSNILNAALAIKDPNPRAKLLAVLVTLLKDELLEEAVAQALRTAVAVDDNVIRCQTLKTLIPHLYGEQREATIGWSLETAFAIDDHAACAEALAGLVPYLSAHQKIGALEKGLRAALAIKDDVTCARMLAALAPHLEVKDKKFALANGLALALSISDQQARVKAIVALLPSVNPDRRDFLLMRALDSAFAVRGDMSRVLTLALLIPHLQVEKRNEILKQSTEIALSLDYEEFRAKALATILPYLAREDVQSILAVALSIKDEASRIEVLAALAPLLSEEERKGVISPLFEVALSFRSEGLRAWALTTLTPYFNENQLTNAIKEAQMLTEAWSRVRLLTKLALYVPGTERTNLITLGFEAMLAIRDEHWRARALCMLAPNLRGDQIQHGVEVASAIVDEKDRIITLGVFLPMVADQSAVLKSIWSILIDCLFMQRSEKREDLLGFCAEKTLFSPPILSQQELSAIADQISEICWDWRWL